MTWLRSGTTCLAVSFVAALLLPNGDTIIGDRTVYVIGGWVERTGFWLGMIFIGGHVLSRVFRPERNL